MIKVSVIFGTRPEAIKMATVIKEFEHQNEVALNVCFTGQHREMVLPLLDFFEIKVNHSLDVMQPNQTLAGLGARSLMATDEYLNSVKPDLVFVQGDTTTAMSAATASFYHKIKVAHIEAGLRTHNMFSPFPEEFNRQVISKIAYLHFAPTNASAKNLLTEGISPNKVFVTGNTVIDALLFTQQKVKKNPLLYQKHYNWEGDGKKIILITGHRRENFGEGFENICSAIRVLALKFNNYNFIYPVHLNPKVQEPVMRILKGVSNIHLVSPMDYIQFTTLMSKSYLILTDSGGVQEEAPSFGKPVLIMRDTTEREEAIQAGAAKLIGTTKSSIINNVTELLENEELFDKMSNVVNPFGDGLAAKKIVKHTLANYL